MEPLFLLVVVGRFVVDGKQRSQRKQPVLPQPQDVFATGLVPAVPLSREFPCSDKTPPGLHSATAASIRRTCSGASACIRGTRPRTDALPRHRAASARSSCPEPAGTDPPSFSDPLARYASGSSALKSFSSLMASTMIGDPGRSAVSETQCETRIACARTDRRRGVPAFRSQLVTTMKCGLRTPDPSFGLIPRRELAAVAKHRKTSRIRRT